MNTDFVKSDHRYYSWNWTLHEGLVQKGPL